MNSKKKSWQVVIETRGQCGTIHYSEGAKTIRFNWEFGGRDIIAFIWGPGQSAWEKEYIWARTRRKEILSRVAEEAIRQKASGCRAEIDFN